MSEYDDSWQSDVLKADDATQLHLVGGGPADGGGLSVDEARAWLTQPVPTRSAGRTMIPEEVPTNA